MDGYAVDPYAAYERLKPYPEDIKELFFSHPKHFAHSSAVYNRMFSIADTYLDNGRGNTVESFNADSSLTVNGAVKYFIRKDVLKGLGGLSYFTFDGLERFVLYPA
jgi:hypothetical protein